MALSAVTTKTTNVLKKYHKGCGPQHQRSDRRQTAARLPSAAKLESWAFRDGIPRDYGTCVQDNHRAPNPDRATHFGYRLRASYQPLPFRHPTCMRAPKPTLPVMARRATPLTHAPQRAHRCHVETASCSSTGPQRRPALPPPGAKSTATTGPWSPPPSFSWWHIADPSL